MLLWYLEPSSFCHFSYSAAPACGIKRSSTQSMKWLFSFTEPLEPFCVGKDNVLCWISLWLTTPSMLRRRGCFMRVFRGHRWLDLRSRTLLSPATTTKAKLTNLSQTWLRLKDCLFRLKFHGTTWICELDRLKLSIFFIMQCYVLIERFYILSLSNSAILIGLK